MAFSQKQDLNISPSVLEAEVAIGKEFGDRARSQVKKKFLRKFGRRTDLGTSLATVWGQSDLHETYQTDNLITRIVSTDVNDTQECVIEGHTISGSELTFRTFSVTLQGTTPVTLPVALARANRLYNNGSTDFAGTVTVTNAGATLTFLSASGNNNQSLKAATTMSYQDYMVILSVMGSVNRQTSASVDFRLQTRRFGKVFRTQVTWAAHSNGGASVVELSSPVIVPPNSDVRIIAVASTNSVSVDASFAGDIALIV